MKIFEKELIPLFLVIVMLASCNSFTSTLTTNPTNVMESAISTVNTAVAETQIVIASDLIVYYYFVTRAENPLPEGSIVISPDAYILAPTRSDKTFSPDTAADLRSALGAALNDGRNGWISSNVEIVDVTFSNGHADVVLQGEYFGVGDVTLIAGRMQILMTVFANAAVQTATVTLNGGTIWNLGISHSSSAKTDDYVYTRAEIETFMKEHAAETQIVIATETPISPALLPASPTPLPFTDPSKSTAWSTYHNNQHGFTFEYPTAYDDALYKDSCGIKEDNNGIHLGHQIDLLFLESHSNSINLAEYANTILESKGWTSDSLKNVAINGLEAVVVEYRFGGTNRFGTFTLIQHNTRVFVFNFSAGSFCDIPEAQVFEPEVYSHMLETFRLLP